MHDFASDRPTSRRHAARLPERLWRGGLALALLLAAARVAHAQPEPPKVFDEKAPYKAPNEDVTTLAASLGGTLNTGNTRTWQLNLGSDLLLVRMPHSLTAMVVFAYGQADLPNDNQKKLQTTIKNLRSKARYDFFLTRMDALFAAAAFRWDQLAGLDARVQGELGYLRYFYRSEKHRFWGEVGYDLTYDDYHPLPNPDYMVDAMGNPVDRTVPELTSGGTKVIHSGRVFVGYDNRLTEAVTYLGGVETLLDVEQARNVRLNIDNAVRSKLGGNFQLELKVSLQWANVPAPGARKLDTQSMINLIYNLI